MKNKEQTSSRPIETDSGARVPFFAKRLDPEVLRSIRGGDDVAALNKMEQKIKIGE